MFIKCYSLNEELISNILHARNFGRVQCSWHWSPQRAGQKYFECMLILAIDNLMM